MKVKDCLVCLSSRLQILLKPISFWIISAGITAVSVCAQIYRYMGYHPGEKMKPIGKRNVTIGNLTTFAYDSFEKVYFLEYTDL
jgi:hypothetical protein